MGGIAKLVKELKSSVEEIKKEIAPKEKEKDEVEEILQAQLMIDQIIVANSDAIKRIDREI